MNTILTLYSGIVEENFSNVDGPISAGVQPRKKVWRNHRYWNNSLLLQVIAYMPFQ